MDSYVIQILPLLAIALGVAQLLRHPLVDPQGTSSPEMPKVITYYLLIPFWAAIFTPIVGVSLQETLNFPYTITVMGLQTLAWGAGLLSLSLAGRWGKVNFVAIRDYLRKERHYRLPYDRTFLRLVLLALLLLSTAFEVYRGLWLFFGLAIIWFGLIGLGLWQVWKYAFPE